MDRETKLCITCKIEQSVSNYYTSRKGECKECSKQRVNRWRLRNKDKRRIFTKRWWLKSKYGLTLEQYHQLLEKQNHCCALCYKHENEQKRSLAVDHNHETGKVRGLLCDVCNYRIIGPRTEGDFFRRVADYLDAGNT